jgi:CBS domain-containing protein
MRRVEELMTRTPLITVGSEAPVAHALRLIEQHDISHLLVMEQERLFGVVCACDLERADICAPIALSVAASAPVTVDVAATAFDAARYMLAFEIGCLPVTRGGALVGMLTAGDLRRAGILNRATEECAACGSRDHVRRAHGLDDVGFCLECRRQSEPPTGDDEIGGG